MPELRDLKPEQLKAAIDNYFKMNEAKGDFPDYAGMLIYLGNASEDDVTIACKENSEIGKLFDYAKKRRESFLIRRMTRDSKNASGCMNALKQSINGGYSDKAKDKGERKLIIDFKGIGEDAYK